MSKSVVKTSTKLATSKKIVADPRVRTGDAMAPWAETPKVRTGDAMAPWAEAPKVRTGDAMMPW